MAKYLTSIRVGLKLMHVDNYMFCVAYGYKDLRYWEYSSNGCKVRAKTGIIEIYLCTAKVFTAIFTYGKISVRRNFLRLSFFTAKFPCGETSHGGYSFGEISRGEFSYGENSNGEIFY